LLPRAAAGGGTRPVTPGANGATPPPWMDLPPRAWTDEPPGEFPTVGVSEESLSTGVRTWEPLDADGQSIATLDAEGIERLIASRTATAGMIAKLDACRAALMKGVPVVRIVDGSDFAAGEPIESVRGTTVVLEELGAR